MNLKIYTPTGIALETTSTQIDFESVDGFFTLLPRHMDIVSALRPSVLSYRENNQKHYVACNKGVLVKKGDDVSVSTHLAIGSDDLELLQHKISVDFKQMEEERKEINLTMAKLELGLTKGFISLNREDGHGGL